VFLCYAREDSTRVDELEHALRAAGCPVWRDTSQLWPGQDWRLVIGQAITHGALVFLACFSSRSAARRAGYQNAELALAADQARLRRAGDSWLIPVRFDECELPELDLGGGRRLSAIQRADLFGAKADVALGHLVEAVRLILGAAPGAAGLAEPSPGASMRIVVGDIPLRPPEFQERPRLMSALLGKSPSGVFAVTGLRGTGKTQLAAALVRRRLAERWPVIAWVDATSRDSLLAGYAELAEALDLAGNGSDSEIVAVRVRRWLEGGDQDCLVVLDNAISADVVRPFLPAGGSAQVVMTSSRASLAALGTAVPMGVFTEDEGSEYLAKRTGLADDTGAVEVARELGYLPLALTQAGAVIAGQRLSYRAYLTRLGEITVEQYLARAEEDPYPRGTAEAITLAVDAALASDTSGLGERMLTMLALMSEAGAPRSLLALAAGVNQEVADSVMSHLARWSLVSLSMDGTGVTAHRLVLRVLRERAASAGTLAEAVSDSIGALEAMLPAHQNAWRYPEMMQDFVIQITALAAHLDEAPGMLLDCNWEEKFLDLLAWAGWHLNELADISSSVPLLERVLADRERVLGSDHPHTMTSRNNLAYAYQSAGRLSDAVPLYQRALSDRERVLGSDHPHAMASRNNLAYAYQSAGRLVEAVPLYRQTLADRERVLGINHPDTLTSRNNLAYVSAGKLSDAVPLYQQTLAERERVLGADHPHTMTSRNNLAYAYQSAGRLSDAIPLYQRALADRERVLGVNHPDALASRNNLAGAYESAGRLSDAIPLYEQTLADSERALGASHPLTQTIHGNYVRARGRLSRP
jgi:tetratricopeptide (TPR) repeat protein